MWTIYVLFMYHLNIQGRTNSHSRYNLLMYYPSTRLLTILDLLRAHGQMSARDLATHLEVDARTVRRYVVMLEDLGMPVETVRGRYGGYRLRPGYKLPPIVFADDEVLGLTLGLLFARHLGLSGLVKMADLAISKMVRVMPDALREQAHMLNETLVIEAPPSSWPAPAEMIMTLSMATYQRQRIRMRYNARDDRETAREVDPYGLVFIIGMWYVAGYCHLRQALRTFRIDRIQQAELGDKTFTRPADFDAFAHVEAAIVRTPSLHLAEVLLQTSLAEAKRIIPPAQVMLDTHEDGVLMRGYVEDLGQFAHFLLGLPWAMTIHGPPALSASLRALSRRADQLAA